MSAATPLPAGAPPQSLSIEPSQPSLAGEGAVGGVLGTVPADGAAAGCLCGGCAAECLAIGASGYRASVLDTKRRVQGGSRGLLALACAVAAAALVATGVRAGSAAWSTGAPVPLARSEVAAALVGREIAVVGGFLENGTSSTRVEAYASAEDRWRRLPDLPIAVNHPMAAAADGRLYVVGGYVARQTPTREAFVLAGRRWRRLPPMPGPRAAAGAAVVGRRLYVVGGIGRGGLARGAFAFDLDRRRWVSIAGPTPREHLGVTAAAGQVYAVAGRTAGYDTNLDLVEAYAPGRGRWRRLPPVPEARGGTGLTTLGTAIVSVGGEEEGGTIASVYAYGLAERRWRRLPDLPTARHGLGVVAAGDRVYVLAGGEEPGLTVSTANEALQLP